MNNQLISGVKEELKGLEIEATEQNQLLKDVVRNKLDYNKDGKLTKSDFIQLLIRFIDVNNDGVVSIWEYITLFFRIRKIIKDCK